MEHVGGAVLVLLGLLILVFGNAYSGSGREGGSTWLSPGRVVDSLLKWGMGLLCIWFGVVLYGKGIHL